MSGDPAYRRGPLTRQDIKRHNHKDARSRLPPAESLPAAMRAERCVMLREKLEQLDALKQQQTQLESRVKLLTHEVKQHLLAGDYAETSRVFPELRLPSRAAIAFQAFLDTFGPELTAQVVSISIPAVRALQESGQLSAEQLRSITRYEPQTPALSLVDKLASKGT